MLYVCGFTANHVNAFTICALSFAVIDILGSAMYACSSATTSAQPPASNYAYSHIDTDAQQGPTIYACNFTARDGQATIL